MFIFGGKYYDFFLFLVCFESFVMMHDESMMDGWSIGNNENKHLI